MSDPRHEMARDMTAAAAHAVPGVAASAFTLDRVVATLTIILVCLQIGYLIWKWRKEILARIADQAAIKLLMSQRIAKYGEKAPRE